MFEELGCFPIFEVHVFSGALFEPSVLADVAIACAAVSDAFFNGITYGMQVS